jgi:multicomponent Na+:H+ antiporter subunit E
VKHLGLVALLVALWILAWGHITLANVLSGVVVTVGLLLAFPPRRRGEDASNLRYNALGIARLGAYVGAQLVTSNVVMTRQILRRDTARHAGILAHRLQDASEEVATVMSSIIALSPGTMTVDVAPDSSVVYVHFFDLRDVDAARAGLTRLERRVTDAIAVGPIRGRASVDEPSSEKESP